MINFNWIYVRPRQREIWPLVQLKKCIQTFELCSLTSILDVLSLSVTYRIGLWFPPSTPVSLTNETDILSPSIDMTLAFGEALRPNKPINTLYD